MIFWACPAACFGGGGARWMRSADGGIFHVLIDKGHVLRKVCGKHRHKFFSLSVIGRWIGPRIARIQQFGIHARQRNRHSKAKVCIGAELALGQ